LQDHDGSHIKGLIMNFFHHFYPSLLKMPGFLVEFITPIIKASAGWCWRGGAVGAVGQAGVVCRRQEEDGDPAS